VPVPPADQQLGELEVRRLVRQLGVVDEELAGLAAELEQRFAQLPDAPIFQSLPGAGPVLAPALFSILGDNRAAWSDAAAIARACGTVPITVQSGGPGKPEMRRRCDLVGRRSLHLFANCSRRSCAWANQFYLRQRQSGKKHAAALRNLATKWLRILYRLWRSRIAYDEAIYLKRLDARQSPLASA
jgi:transposase